MKFIVYNVRDDEIPFVQKWGKDHGVEVAYDNHFESGNG